MADRSPEFIQRFIDEHQYRMDLPSQLYGDEPNTYRKPWDDASVRWLMCASWPYEEAAGNQSIPAVYKSVNDASDTYLCDRFYLPATPRDMRTLERGGVPVFGIESKHQLRDFDVVGTSISYLVLLMSFAKMLSMSDMPLRWREREEQGAENFPMVIIGGQSYGAPEAMAPLVDCVWLGEVEDEPGNGGIGQVCARIDQFKAEQLWQTDRLECYRKLAQEFNYLYFPRFVAVEYEYQDRPHAELEHQSKQVKGYRSTLPGMRMPFTARKIKDMNAVRPLDNPPLLFSDPSLGSGDLEVGRGCPAWSVPCTESVEIAGRGSVPFHTVQAGEQIRVGSEYRTIAGVAIHGEKETIKVATVQGHELECTPEHEILCVSGGSELSRADRDVAPRAWRHASELRPGDLLLRTVGGVAWPQSYTPIEFAELEYRVGRGRTRRYYSVEWPDELTPDVAWFLGMATGDCYVRGNQLEFRIENRALALQDRLRSVVKSLFDVALTERQSTAGDSTHFNLNSKRMVNWLESNFGIRDNVSRKQVPSQIFQSPRSCVAAYLSALYDCNGTSLIPKTANSSVTIRFVVYAEKQIRQIAELLRMLGLPSAVRSEVRDLNRDGTPSARPSVKWECRTTGSDSEDAYNWLESLEPFKTRHLSQFRPPASKAAAQAGLQYLVVSGFKPGQRVRVMDVDVPGAQAFNVSGLYVHNCSFCALTFRQKPYRQRSVSFMTEFAANFQRNVGSVELSPFMPDFPMHTQRKALIASLLENVSDEVDAVAMRVDDFIADGDYILLQVQGGMSSVTLGLEGNSQRMRDLVGKGTSDQDVEEAVIRGIRAGLRKFKFFMITNMPGEDDGDVFRIVQLARRLADIRDQLNQPSVRIQFSWTPLLIEANTPFQWFAPTPANHSLIDVADAFRDLKIDFKIGTKAEPNKVSYFQLCQRASREVGEAIIDVLEKLNTACWGGVPRTMQEDLTESLIAHGFLNGFGDCFDERFKSDMFGWEFIDQGVSAELLWVTYQQMLEFVQYTDSETYDGAFAGQDYHGNEWISRCDTTCLGRTCGVCDHKDLRIRTGYIRAAQQEADIDLGRVKSVDQTSVAMKIRVKITKPERHRFVMNDHWRFNVRRAAYRASQQHNLPGIAKRSIRFASDALKYKDWTCGTDYMEFAVTRPMSAGQVKLLLSGMKDELSQWMSLEIDGEGWAVFPPNVSMASSADLSLFELEVDADAETMAARLSAWERAEYIKMVLKQDARFFALATEEVNAKDFVDDLWVVRDGHKLLLRMLVRGKAGPYNVYAALMGKASWIEAASKPAVRIDSFVEVKAAQGDFFRPSCMSCGYLIPVGLLDEPWDAEHCPRCADEVAGRLVAALVTA